MPEGGMVQMMMSLAAGAGFKNVSEGMKKMAESGQDAQSLFSLPNMPLFLAGAGTRDLANSMELLGPLMKMMQPPPQPQDQPDPQQMAAAMQMLSARLGPGLSGIQAPPPGMPGMGGGPGMPPGMGAPGMPGAGGPMMPPGMGGIRPPMPGL
jgi:hypothetical protein